MFDKLEKHHIGFVTSLNEKVMIEKKFNKKFIFDPLQQTHVMFIYDEYMKIYKEYICQEGRVKNHKLGYAHICYNVNDIIGLEKVEKFINDKKMGFKLTNLEKSGSNECGHIMFYFLKHIGVVELNVTGEN